MMNIKDVDVARTTSERGPSGLAERIEGSIERMASGRIRDLLVVCDDDRIILAGRTRTHHAKQIALQAALDLAGGRATLADQIVVRC